MADIYDPNLDEDEEEGAAGAEAGGAPGAGGPTAPVSGAGENPNVSPGSGAAPGVTSSGGSKAGSGRFQNIQKYISANQDADYAGRIGQDLQKQSDALKANLTTAQSNIESQVNPELQRLQGAQTTIQGALANPVEAAANQQQVDEFNRLRTGNYLQNVGIANKGNIMQQQQQLGQSAEMARTEPGRFQLLRQTFAGSPTYTPGATKLDQLLLQSKSGQLKSLIPQAQASAQAGQQALTGLESSVAGYNQQLGQLGGAAQQQAQSGIEGLIGTSKGDLEARRAQEQAARQAEFQQSQQAIQNLASTGRISADMAQRMGLQAGQNLYGIDAATLAQHAQKGALDVGLQNVTTAEDVAKFKALQSLSGVEGLGDFSSVGPQLGGAVNYAPEALQASLAQKQGAYQADLQGKLGSSSIGDSLNFWLKGGGGGSDYYKQAAEQALSPINALQKTYGQAEYKVVPYSDPNTGRKGFKYVPITDPRSVQVE